MISRAALFILIFFISITPLTSAAERSFNSADDSVLTELQRMHNHADLLIQEGKIREALKVYDEILLYEPDDEAAYVNMGSLYLVLGYYDKAEEAFYNALHINPDNEDALQGLEKIRNPDMMPDLSERKLAEPTDAPAEDAPILTRDQQIQLALKKAGLYTGNLDGKMGPLTKQAIQKFQDTRGLQPDGEVGPKTWAALSPYLDTKEEASNSTN
jgi:tetratricopeptide (TPR) repeat protein